MKEKATLRELEIWDIVDNLDGITGALSTTAEQLLDRLAPITAKTPEEAAPADTKYSPARCSLGETLCTILITLDKLNTTLNDMLGRLEI